MSMNLIRKILNGKRKLLFNMEILVFSIVILYIFKAFSTRAYITNIRFYV